MAEREVKNPLFIVAHRHVKNNHLHVALREVKNSDKKSLFIVAHLHVKTSHLGTAPREVKNSLFIVAHRDVTNTHFDPTWGDVENSRFVALSTWRLNVPTAFHSGVNLSPQLKSHSNTSFHGCKTQPQQTLRKSPYKLLRDFLPDLTSCFKLISSALSVSLMTWACHCFFLD